VTLSEDTILREPTITLTRDPGERTQTPTHDLLELVSPDRRAALPSTTPGMAFLSGSGSGLRRLTKRRDTHAVPTLLHMEATAVFVKHELGSLMFGRLATWPMLHSRGPGDRV
jgi:hypothetical protein